MLGKRYNLGKIVAPTLDPKTIPNELMAQLSYKEIHNLYFSDIYFAILTDIRDAKNK